MVSIHLNVVDQNNNPIEYNWRVALQDNISEVSGTGFGDSYIGIAHDQTNQTAQVIIWLENNPSLKQSFSVPYFGSQDIGTIQFTVESVPIPASTPQSLCNGVTIYRGVIIWDNVYCQEYANILTKWYPAVAYPSPYLPNAHWILYYTGMTSTSDTGSQLIPSYQRFASLDETKAYIDSHINSTFYLFDGSKGTPYALNVPSPTTTPVIQPPVIQPPEPHEKGIVIIAGIGAFLGGLYIYLKRKKKTTGNK